MLRRLRRVTAHPDRTRAKLGEATKLAASVFVPPVLPPHGPIQPPPRDSLNINKQLEAFVQLASTVLPILSTFVPQLKMLIPILPVLTGLLKMGDDIAQAGNDPAKVADALAGHLKGVAQQVQALKLPGQS